MPSGVQQAQKIRARTGAHLAFCTAKEVSLRDRDAEASRNENESRHSGYEPLQSTHKSPSLGAVAILGREPYAQQVSRDFRSLWLFGGLFLQRNRIGHVFGRLLVQQRDQLAASGRNSDLAFADNLLRTEASTVEFFVGTTVRPKRRSLQRDPREQPS